MRPTQVIRFLGVAFATLTMAVQSQAQLGVPITAPAALNASATTDIGDDNLAQVATDGLGNWVAVWQSFDTLGGTIGTDGDILVARSTNNGATWSAPAVLNSYAAADMWSDWHPQITTDRLGNWVAVWSSFDTLGGTIGTGSDILVALSTDNGSTWTDPAALNTNAATDIGDDFFAQVATDGLGNWVAVWNSPESLGGTIGHDQDILVARSTNNGVTWTAPAPLNTNAPTDNSSVDSSADVRPQVTTDGLGNWVAVWESVNPLGEMIGTDFDILVARSTNNGVTWTAPVPLSANATANYGNDLNPQVTTDGLGNWLAVWESHDSLGGTIGTDMDILVARSTDSGVTWTAPAPLNANAASDGFADFDPQVTADGLGNWVAVWHSGASDDGGIVPFDLDIRIARSTDNGATWTAPVALNENASSDGSLDDDAQVTTDGLGNWIVVWRSGDSLGGTIGDDNDVLFARFQINRGPVPAVSSWGVVVLLLVILTVGTLVFRRGIPLPM